MRKQVRSLYSLYWLPRSATVLTYMLQATEYQPVAFLRWLWHTNDFARVMHRRTLDLTRAARMIRLVTLLGMVTELAFAVMLVFAGIQGYSIGAIWYGLALGIAYPVLWAHLMAVGIWVAHVTVGRSRNQRYAAEATALFGAHQGLRIAIAGSYGKTTMKDILQTVLAEGKRVAATPGNMNVLSSHAAFARNLSGDEDIVLVEFGEGKPGDVAQFAAVVQPTHAVITGLAPAHLDQYKTLAAAGQDIFSLSAHVEASHLYVNADSPAIRDFVEPGFRIYSRSTVLGWQVQKSATDVHGTQFELIKGKRRLLLKSKLVGLHQVGPLAFAAAFGLEVGLSEKQVKAGMAKTVPFEHRMQPYQLGGAWVIDDTYNGNLEGIKAGTELLGSLTAKRKIYVTPGLVDQGKETASIHQQIGHYIAAVEPAMVVLMRNSVTAHIAAGLKAARYQGHVRIEDDPLAFYQNLSHFVAAGDVVLMQNDWTDNYS